MARVRRRFQARFVNAGEQQQFDEHNGVVEDITFRPVKRVCFASPKALADRIAALLNFGEAFDDEQIERIGKV